MLNKSSYLFTLIILYSSFAYNFLGVSGDFNSFENYSEQLVIDSLSLLPKTENHSLGRYIDSEKKQRLYAESVHDFENSVIIDYPFEKYVSQYGLQGDFFYFFVEKFNTRSIKTLKNINSILFSIMLLIIFNWIVINIDRISAFIFLGSIVLSPWVIDFSNNLYWVPFTWLLPFVLTLKFLLKANEAATYLIIFYLALTFSFYIKFMSGFEYITTIGIFTVTPILYFHYLKTLSNKHALKLFIVIILSFSTAFALSINSYINKFGKENLSQIVNKRVDTGAMKSIEDCQKYEIQHCELYVKSLNSNSLLVMGKYFIFEGFLPYTKYSDEVLESSSIIIRGLLKGVNLTFILLVVVCFVIALRNKTELAMLLFCMLSPLSWYILAKGHSYIHPHLNYILWYMPFVPASLIYIYRKLPLIINKNRIKLT